MPPQGESTGLAIEDAILFSRVLEAWPEKTLIEVFDCYVKTRKPIIDASYKDAVERWGYVNDKS